jgi:hypothetical protein
MSDQQHEPSHPAPLPRPLWYGLGAAYQYVVDHLVLAGLFLYAYVTLIGLLYSEAVYWTIGINPLDFFEPTDFLLAGLRHPVALTIPVVIFIFYVGLLLIMDLPTSWLRKRFHPAEPDAVESAFRNLVFRLTVFYGIVAALVAAIFIPTLAMMTFDDCSQPVNIYLRKEVAIEVQPTKALSRTIVGSTQRMLLLKDTQANTYAAMPLEVVAEIVHGTQPKGDTSMRIICTIFH